MSFYLRSQLLVVDEEDAATLFVEIEESHVDRRIVDVAGGAEIRCPGNIVEGREEDGVGLFAGGLLHYTVHAAARFLANNTLIVDEELVGRTCRTLGPDVVEQREVVVELHAFVGQLLLHTLGGVHRERHAVYGHRFAGRNVLCEPFHQVNGVGTIFGHHLKTGALQLVGCLDEVARVGPAESLVRSYHSGAVGAVFAHEAGEPFAAAPVSRRILALMGVSAAYHHGIDAGIGHGLAKSLKILQIFLFHGLNYFVVSVESALWARVTESLKAFMESTA
ncbi:unknown [Prevotella sp. CAG:485]|nr:unknown [Prevotella sp. CAG:485]